MNDNISTDGQKRLRARHLDEDYGDATLCHKQFALSMLQFLPALAQTVELSPDAANLDGSGLINFIDYSVLAGDFQTQGMSLRGDITGDGAVNLKDIAVFAEFWLE
jgi:hypothetical protein